MSPSQYQALYELINSVKNDLEKRLQRLEVAFGTLTGGLILGAFLISNDLLKIK